jgi:hypothetical protein
MPRRKGGCKGSGRKRKLQAWATRGRGKQRGGFVFSMAAIGAAISAGLASSAGTAITTGALTAASGYGTTKALQAMTGGRRRRLSRRIRH